MRVPGVPDRHPAAARQYPQLDTVATRVAAAALLPRHILQLARRHAVVGRTHRRLPQPRERPARAPGSCSGLCIPRPVLAFSRALAEDNARAPVRAHEYLAKQTPALAPDPARTRGLDTARHRG